MFKEVVRNYLSSVWKPVGLVMVLLVLALAMDRVITYGPSAVHAVLMILLVIALASIFAAAYCQFAKHRWVKGPVSLILGLALCTLTYWTGTVNLTDWDTAEVLEPFAGDFPVSEAAKDEEGAWLTTPGASPQGQTVSVDRPIFEKFTGVNRELLLRHLATSAKWFLTERNGEVVAYRRFVTNRECWANTYGLGYSQRDLHHIFDNRIANYCLMVGPNRGAFRLNSYTTIANTGAGTVEIALEKHTNPVYFDSDLLLISHGACLDAYEGTETPSRDFTIRAVSKVEEELTALWNSETARTRGFDPSLMPPESITRGEPELHVMTGDMFGYYNVFAHVNPGEPGHVYLEAYAGSQSVLPWEKESVEHIGWSGDPKEQFFYGTQVMMSSTLVGSPYAARFELWFEPSNGGPARKLVEKTYRVVGWER